MAYKHFNRSLLFKVSLLVINSIVLGFCLGWYRPPELIVLLVVLEITFIARLIILFNHTNRQINFFIQAVKNEDTSLLFPRNTGNSTINELHKSLNELNQIIQQSRIKNQLKEQYFSEILHNIGTAVIVFNNKGFVINTNQAALSLFGLQTFTHLSQLDKVDAHFKTELFRFNNQQSQSLLLRRLNENLQLSVRCTILNLKDEEVKLITLQDIRGELERKELDSWVKLIKVLNHEIMNSLVPVTSIAQSLKEIWKAKEGRHEDGNAREMDVTRTINGLDVIVERGEALMRFVESYRLFTRMPDLHLSEISMQALFDRLSILVSPMKEQYGVSIQFYTPEPDFLVKLDEQLMVQVIINLVKNSAEAVSSDNKGLIEIRCSKNETGKKTEITVADNGPGIPPEIADEIFVPFFTTKTTGSGIGLSYSRQILRAHGGTINCYSKPGNTVFTVRW